MPITLENNELVIRAPHVHADAILRTTFHRTDIVPNDGRIHNLPPSRGRFQLAHMRDCNFLPAEWRTREGVVMPIHNGEAMWIDLRNGSYPFAIKVCTGMVCAVTGHSWSETLSQNPQNYMINGSSFGEPGRQPWIDGFKTTSGEVRQFVATPLGEGLSVEEQLRGTTIGGIQFLFIPLRGDVWEQIKPRYREPVLRGGGLESMSMATTKGMGMSMGMGVGAGGQIRQTIATADLRPDQFDMRAAEKVFVSLLHADLWQAVSGKAPHPAPVIDTPAPKPGVVPGAPAFAGIKPVPPADGPHTVKPGNW